MKLRVNVYKNNTIEKIVLYFRSLPDNWDNYNSPAVSSQAINTFEKFTIRFFRFLYLRHTIDPVAGGGIQIDFNYDNKIASFEIYPDGTIGLEKFDTVNSGYSLVPEHSVFYMDNPHMIEHIDDLFEWLIK
jgi:hypothetical protein